MQVGTSSVSVERGALCLEACMIIQGTETRCEKEVRRKDRPTGKFFDMTIKVLRQSSLCNCSYCCYYQAVHFLYHPSHIYLLWLFCCASYWYAGGAELPALLSHSSTRHFCKRSQAVKQSVTCQHSASYAFSGTAVCFRCFFRCFTRAGAAGYTHVLVQGTR